MDRFARLAALAFCLTLTTACAQSRPRTPIADATVERHYERRDAVQTWIATTVERTGLAADDVRAAVQAARYAPRVARAILPTSPAVQRSWRAYRARFIEPKRIDAGLRFWADHATELERAHLLFGVPPEVVVAVIGIETLYGVVPGNDRAIDVFATLGFDWPADAPRDRSALFRDEFAELLMLANEHHLDVTTVRGSYAGALGLPQFLPSSVRRYAVDFDGDGTIDVLASPADAIGSVAHFLAAHGWQRDGPLWFDAALAAGAQPAPLISNDLVARMSFDDLREALVTCAVPDDDRTTPLGLIDLDTPNEPLVWKCAAPNFFAITHYNRSFFYAGAVTEVASALRDAHAANR